MKTHVFDLDGTLCLPNLSRPDTNGRYAEAVPIMEVILKLRKIHLNGDRVIIHTARRMLTHGGDVRKVEADVGQVTRDWLAKHEVPYHELIFGKPYGDVYIDDKAMRPEEMP